MTDPTWSRMWDVFHAALEKPAAAREAFVREACAHDGLAEEVLSLLRQHEARPDFLSQPLVSAPDGLDERNVPERIGSYRILRVLAEGGMGVVYLAEQENPRRTVALKVIRPGSTSPAMLRRFHLEAQLLGRLQHPGIAAVYEAGTADAGRGVQPFMAMEHVDGLPITRFADERHLDARARMSLLADVCDAAHHAHQRGVVHRDLKPANVLVDADGRPRIVDFGIAHAMGAEPEATLTAEVGSLLGTLAYMSPEQVSGRRDAVTAATDVYALGVLGFELLSGRLPLEVRGAPITQAVRTIAESPPTPLGSLDARFRGDVETVFAKALEKEPRRRYESAAALAADLRCVIDGRPIQARRSGPIERGMRFVRREPAIALGGAMLIGAVGLAAVGGVFAAFTAMGIGLAGTTAGLVRAKRAGDEADRQRRMADRAAAKAQRVQSFLTEMLASFEPGQMHKDPSVKELLSHAAARAERELAGEPEIEAAVANTLGRTYLSLGMLEEAERLIERGLVLRQGAHRGDHRDVAESLLHRASVALERAAYAESEAEYRLARDMLARLGHPEVELDVDACIGLGAAVFRQGRMDEAESLFREAVDRLRATPEPEPVALAKVNLALGVLLRLTERLDEALERCREAHVQFRTARGPNHPDVATAINNLAVILHSKHEYVQAESLYRESLAMRRALYPPEHGMIAQSLNALAGLLRAMDRAEEALPLLEESLAIRRRALGPEHPDTAATLNGYGLCLDHLGRATEAEPMLREAHRIRAASLGPNHWQTCNAAANLAKTLFHLGRRDEALELLEPALDQLERTLGAEHEYAVAARNLLESIHQEASRDPVESGGCNAD